MKMFNASSGNNPNFANYFSSNNPLRLGNPHSPKDNYLRHNQPLASQTANLEGEHERSASQKRKDELYENQGQQENQRAPWESKLSLMLSTVSVPQAARPEIDAQRIFKIENNITQSILELREQKITLLQQLSKILDTKNLYEHYVLVASKNSEEKETISATQPQKSPKSKNAARSDTDQLSKDDYVAVQISAPILKRNEQLRLRLKEMQVKEQIFGPTVQETSSEQQQKNQAILEQIIKIRELNSNLRNDIMQKMKNSGQDNGNQNSRYVTFLPQDRQKHFEQKRTNQSQYQQLQQRYNKLVALNRQTPFRMTPEQSQQLENLRSQNQQLLQEVQEMLRQKQNFSSAEVQQLKHRIDENQRQKQAFFNQFQKFKQMMTKVKQENEKLRYELSR